MPWAWCIPSTSSGEVSRRTRITSSPSAVLRTASSAVNASLPRAAPGEAGRPVVRTRAPALSSAEKLGSRNWVMAWGGIRRRASSWVMIPCSTMSTAILTAAAPVR